MEWRMDDVTVARIVHVVAVLFWIGGVGFVTLVILPAIRDAAAESDRTNSFVRMERRFAPQARIWVLLAGVSGFWMMWRDRMWLRFQDPAFWWMHAMLLIWLIFAMILYVIEPLLRRHKRRSPSDSTHDFRFIMLAHYILLTLAIIALIGAVGGSHGFF